MKLWQAFRLQPQQGEVVSFVGGGGKSSALFRLGNELAGQYRVLLTTSTRIFTAQIKRAPAHIAFDATRQTITDLMPRLEQAINQHGQVLLIGETTPEGKAFGVAPQTIDALAATGQFDVILNEADGSRMRPFKAPAAHEPVVPPSTTLLVPVVGLDVLGQPLTAEAVHRPEIVAALSDSVPQQSISIEKVAQVLTHPHGGLKNRPPQARVIPLLNKTDVVPPNTAFQLAHRLLRSPAIEAVVSGSVGKQWLKCERHDRIGAVILAAGGSRRFGSPKQLATWKGQTFIERVTEIALASHAWPIVVVLGAEVTESQARLASYPVEVVINPAWATGQSSSMQAGLAALPPQVAGAIFLLVDLPAISPMIIDALIKKHGRTGAPLVWPEFAGKRGNPVLFDRRLFAELRQVSGDTGGRPVLQAHQDKAACVAVSEATILQDIDHPEDLP